MHLPAAFEMDAGGAFALIEQHPLAQLVVASPDGLLATPVPLIARGNTLVGHLARANTVWRHAGPALALFTGAQAYVSPNWYPSKHEHGKAVPTWNYETVHVHGTLVIHDDDEWKLPVLTALTDRFEAAHPVPWKVTDAPADYLAAMTRGVVGLELTNLRVDAKSKFSQNRSDDDRAGVIDGLSRGDADAQAVATQMGRRAVPDSGT